MFDHDEGTYDDAGNFIPTRYVRAMCEFPLSEPEFIPCIPMALQAHEQVVAAERAIYINPANRRSVGRVLSVIQGFLSAHAEPTLTPEHLAVMTGKMWPASGVNLTVAFPFEQVPADLQARIVSHMNAWGQFCKAAFTLVATNAQVRVSLRGDGYWSYLGTDILSIPNNQPTMNLQGFTMNTPASEFVRVVRHETGHTLGFPHEHMRGELVNRLDVQKTIAYFQQTQGWSPSMIRQQVLTPLSEASIRGTPNADQDSIMCYQLPGSITKDGQPIRGGNDIDLLDQQFAAKLYPLDLVPPPPPPPPPVTDWRTTVTQAAGLLNDLLIRTPAN